MPAIEKEKENDSRTKILTAAWDLASEQGYHAVTMRNIAKAAGVGKSTLYRNYTTKEQVYRDVTIAWGQHFAKRLTEQPVKGETIGERFSTVLEEVMREAERHPNLTAAYVASLLSDTHDSQQSRNVMRSLTPGLFTMAMGDVQSNNQELAGSALRHIMLSSMQLMGAKLISTDRAIADLIQTAELMLKDVWDKP